MNSIFHSASRMICVVLPLTVILVAREAGGAAVVRFVYPQISYKGWGSNPPYSPVSLHTGLLGHWVDQGAWPTGTNRGLSFAVGGQFISTIYDAGNDDFDTTVRARITVNGPVTAATYLNGGFGDALQVQPYAQNASSPALTKYLGSPSSFPGSTQFNHGRTVFVALGGGMSAELSDFAQMNLNATQSTDGSGNTIIEIEMHIRVAAEAIVPPGFNATAGATCHGGFGIQIYAPTATTYSVESWAESDDAAAGTTVTRPILPCGFQPDGSFILCGVRRRYYDPPLAYGYRYTMTGTSKFTSIMEFPAGISATPYIVSVGNQKVGEYTPGQSVDFTTITPGGVSSFVISGITPLTDSTNPVAFPVKLDFDTLDTEEAEFTMTPLLVPQTNLLAAPAGQIQFGWATEPEVRYQIQSSPDLNTWTNDGALLQGSGQVLSVLRLLSPQPANFWRVQIK